MQMGGFFLPKWAILANYFTKYLAKSQSNPTFAIQFTVFELWVFGSRCHIGPTLNQKKHNKMAKEISGYVKLQVKGGAANPAPPVGPALGSKGVNIMEFCKQFNARTQDKQGKVVPVLITVYTDKSFDFVIKTAPAPVQLMEAAKIQKGSKESNRDKVGKVTWDQVEVIAKDKMEDLNAFTVNSAMKMVAGTARSMGITVDGKAPREN